MSGLTGGEGFRMKSYAASGGGLCGPFLPETSEKILAQLNTTARAFDDMDQFGLYPSGNKVTENPETLFERKDMKKVLEQVESLQA